MNIKQCIKRLICLFIRHDTKSIKNHTFGREVFVCKKCGKQVSSRRIPKYGEPEIVFHNDIKDN